MRISKGIAVAIKHLRTAAAALGREVEIFVATNSREIDEVIASLVEKRIGALSITASAILAAIMHDAEGFLHAGQATRAPAIRPAGSV
jgi:hypothetical protein